MAEPIEVDVDPQTRIEALLGLAWDTETQIPNEVLGLIPSDSITVSSLLEKTLPNLLQSSAANLRSVDSCVSHIAARWTIEELLKAPIPPRTWLGDLDITLKKRWFTPCTRVNSVRHPTILDLRLPLWIGRFWYSLVGAVEQKKEWRRAEGWVLCQEQDEKAYEARELMRRIPWGMRVHILAGADSSSFVGVLARFLSANWLAERNLDTLVSHLNFRARNEMGGAGEYWVGDVYLSICVKRMYRAAKKDINANWDLTKYQNEITKHGHKRLLFPANLNGNHWIVFGVDLVKSQFCYGTPSRFSKCGDALPLYDPGDSLGAQIPSTDLQRTCRGLENWLSVAFGVPFRDLGNTLPVGRQKDGHSCGVCVINAMEHAMFGVPLFTDEDRFRLRIRYFVEAINYLLDKVGITFFIEAS